MSKEKIAVVTAKEKRTMVKKLNKAIKNEKKNCK